MDHSEARRSQTAPTSATRPSSFFRTPPQPPRGTHTSGHNAACTVAPWRPVGGRAPRRRPARGGGGGGGDAPARARQLAARGAPRSAQPRFCFRTGTPAAHPPARAAARFFADAAAPPRRRRGLPRSAGGAAGGCLVLLRPLNARAPRRLARRRRRRAAALAAAAALWRRCRSTPSGAQSTARRSSASSLPRASSISVSSLATARCRRR